MRCSMSVAASLLLLTGAARAQSYYGGTAYGGTLYGAQGIGALQSLLGQGAGNYARSPADPCTPQSGSGGAFALLASAMTQAQRDRDCAAERQAQWAAYNAKQKAARDQTDEAAAQQKQQAEAAVQAQAAAQTAAQAKHVASAAREGARRSAQAARARQDRLAAEDAAREAATQAHAAAQQANAALRLRAVALIRAENAPNNPCRAPKLARGVMQGWNGLDTFKELGVQVIDIEHVSTAYFHLEDETFACHGVFVTNRGWKVAGTATMKRNVAGDPLFVWSRDTSQDLSVYDMQPREDAMSPEMASQTKLGPPVPGLTQTVSDNP